MIALHAAGHAVTLRTPEGVELLMHVGIDTVTLKGEGFHPRVKKGDNVKVGEPLIAFDLDFLATHARSLLTQVVITNPERVTAWQRASGWVAAGKDTLFTVVVTAEEPEASAAIGDDGHIRGRRRFPIPPDCTSDPRRCSRAWRRASSRPSSSRSATARPTPAA